MRLRDLTSAPTFQRAAGVLGAEYLRLVWSTNKFSYHPADFYEVLDRHWPPIIAFWHGQHFMVPFFKRDHHRFKVLISRHRDGEINAIAVERLGIGTIRGSGDHGTEFQRKGGMTAFRSMLQTLTEGSSVATTADVPKVARVAGRGVVMLARESGRPILPFAIATSRFKRLNNWDRSVIHLPFGRGVGVLSDPIYVPADADDATVEACRVRLESDLKAATKRAYAAVDREDSHG
jgi:lysophospholipid acyltransferase (LPLAT)-like uncharacterized protein